MAGYISLRESGSWWGVEGHWGRVLSGGLEKSRRGLVYGQFEI